jgi:hypothetical protein
MSDLNEIEAAVRRLSPADVSAFGSWFDRFRASIADAEGAGGLAARLKNATRVERRAMAVHAADKSAEHYHRRLEDLLPDVGELAQQAD